MKDFDYFSFAAGLSRLAASEYIGEDAFPEQERRGIKPLPATEDPDHAYDRKREEWAMQHYENDRQREAEGEEHEDE
jgi:hypothetical protein